MKLKTLLEAVSLEKKDDAQSPCEYFTACGINYIKNMRDDQTGADFEMDDPEIALDAYKQLNNHSIISKNFVIELEPDSNIIRVSFR